MIDRNGLLGACLAIYLRSSEPCSYVRRHALRGARAVRRRMRTRNGGREPGVVVPLLDLLHSVLCVGGRQGDV